NEPFGMTVLALRLSNVANGVSRLHGQVSSKMWKGIWPELPVSEVPITSITNGIHTMSWISSDMAQLYDRYLRTHSRGLAPSSGLGASSTKESAGKNQEAAAGNSRGDREPWDESYTWKRVDAIPDAELWRTHERRRERLVAFARMRLRKQMVGRNALP